MCGLQGWANPKSRNGGWLPGPPSTTTLQGGGGVMDCGQAFADP